MSKSRDNYNRIQELLGDRFQQEWEDQVNTSYDRLRVRRILQAMTQEVCGSHPDWPVDEVWLHVDGAMQILNDTNTFTREELRGIVIDEYNICHASDG